MFAEKVQTAVGDNTNNNGTLHCSNKFFNKKRKKYSQFSTKTNIITTTNNPDMLY